MTKMPVAFIGHGSPMNAIEENQFSKGWRQIAEDMPKPEAILTISAHWYTNETKITAEDNPKMIYDFYGFPEELYNVKYNSKGSPELAARMKNLIENATLDTSWGYDHGTWSVLNVMYPKADIPVIQLSINANADASEHFHLAKKLKPLRDEGVLILGSGNVVHNLGRVDFGMPDGYEWANVFDRNIMEKVKAHTFEDILDYRHIDMSAKLAVPTPEHFYPLLYILGAAENEDSVTVYNNFCVNGGLSMTSYVLGL